MAPKTPDQVYVIVEGKQLEIAASQLVSVVLDQALDLPDMATMSLTGAREWIDQHTFDTGKEIKIDFQQDKQRLNIFMGSIASVEPVYKGNGEVLLKINAYDQAHLMTRGRKSATFKQVTDSDVAGTIARKYGWGLDVQATDLVYDQISQHNLTDLEFLRIRADRIGYQIGVNDKKLYFKKKGQPIRPGGSGAPITLEYPNTMSNFRAWLSSSAQPKKVIVRGWNPKTKEQVIGEATSSDVAPQTKMGRGGGSSAGKFDTDAEIYMSDSGVYSQKEAEILAKAKLDQLTENYILANGSTAGNPSLQPGAKIKVTGSGDFDGTYTVADTVHRFTRSGYETTFRVGHGAPEGAPGGAKGGKAPLTFGIGIVSDNNDPEGMGRVMVKLPGFNDDVQTFWCRIVVPSAGKDRGFFWLPEIGDEVMVAFEGGDQARPYVLGSLWNGVDKPPKSNSDVLEGSAVAKRLMKSRSGHFIQFDDTRGNEKVEIEDKKGNKIVFDCQTDKLTIEFAGDIEMTSRKNITIKAGMAVSIEAGTTFKAKGNASAEMEGTGTAAVKASGPLQIQGVPVTINTGAITVM